MPSPLPLSRTWYTVGNVPFPDTSTIDLVRKSAVWLLVMGMRNQLHTVTGAEVGPEGANPFSWTCEGSSIHGGASGMDGVYRWGDTFNGTTFVSGQGTWIVLKRGDYRVLIHFYSSSQITAHLKKASFTGGTNIAPPDVTSAVLFINQHIVANDGTAAANRFHFSMDNAGSFYSLQSRNGTGYFHTAICMLELDQAKAQDQAPFLAFYSGQASGRGAPFPSSPPYGPAYDMTAGVHAFIITASVVNALYNNADGTYDMHPAFIYTNTAGKLGTRGVFPDAFLTGNAPVASTFPPNVASPSLIVAGASFALPFSIVPAV